ncbi:hypothetical protein ADUPG1_006353, partial [Aduncisulcus paluster]
LISGKRVAQSIVHRLLHDSIVKEEENMKAIVDVQKIWRGRQSRIRSKALQDADNQLIDMFQKDSMLYDADGMTTDRKHTEVYDASWCLVKEIYEKAMELGEQGRTVSASKFSASLSKVRKESSNIVTPLELIRRRHARRASLGAGQRVIAVVENSYGGSYIAPVLNGEPNGKEGKDELEKKKKCIGFVVGTKLGESRGLRMRTSRNAQEERRGTTGTALTLRTDFFQNSKAYGMFNTRPREMSVTERDKWSVRTRSQMHQQQNRLLRHHPLIDATSAHGSMPLKMLQTYLLVNHVPPTCFVLPHLLDSVVLGEDVCLLWEQKEYQRQLKRYRHVQMESLANNDGKLELNLFREKRDRGMWVGVINGSLTFEDFTVIEDEDLLLVAEQHRRERKKFALEHGMKVVMSREEDQNRDAYLRMMNKRRIGMGSIDVVGGNSLSVVFERRKRRERREARESKKLTGGEIVPFDPNFTGMASPIASPVPVHEDQLDKALDSMSHSPSTPRSSTPHGSVSNSSP